MTAAEAVELDRPPAARVSRRVRLDALWILAGYAATGGIGFLFWVVAARVVPPEVLGVDTAVFGIVTAAAAIAASGFGDALLVMLPVAGRSRRRLLRTAVLATLAVAGIGGGVAVVLVAAVRPLDALGVVLVLAAVVCWSLFVLKDPILQATGRARAGAILNTVVNVVKLAALPVCALLLAPQGAVLISAVGAAALAVLIAYSVLIRRALRANHEPAGADWFAANRGTFALFSIRAGIASGAYMAVPFALPFLVTTLSGPGDGAVFAICFQLVLVLDLIALAVGASFSTHTALAGEARSLALGVWLRVLAVVGACAVVLVAVAPILLLLLGEHYLASDGFVVIAILSGAAVIRTAYEIWSASLRAQHRAIPGMVFAIVHAAVLLAGGIAAIPAFGAVGAALAVAVATTVLSVAGAIGLLHAHRHPQVRA